MSRARLPPIAAPGLVSILAVALAAPWAGGTSWGRGSLPLARPQTASDGCVAGCRSLVAVAQTEPSAARADSGVELTVVGRPADLQRVRSAIEPRPLGGSAPRWTRVERFNPAEILQTLGDSKAVVRCWVDLTDLARARLYFVARSGEHFLVRDVELSGSFDEIDRESLSNVLELSITALIEDEQVGLTREQARIVLAARPPSISQPQSEPPPLPAPAPAPEGARPTPEAPAERPRDEGPAAGSTLETRPAPAARPLGWPALTVGIFYEALAVGGGLPLAHGPGILLALGGAREDRLALRLWSSGQYQWAARHDGPEVGLVVATIAGRGGLELDWPVGRYQLTARLGAGVDAVQLSPQPGTADPTAMLTPERWSTMAVVTAALGARMRVGARLRVGAALVLEAVPEVVHYDQRVAGALTTVAAPARIRPGLVLEAAFR